ncbi:MAG: TonB-dependent receptor [Phocaeicola sp.]
MKKKLLTVAASLLPLLGMQAQQDSALIRTLVVEHEYNPTILDATKINILPKIEEPATTKAGVEYATALRPLTGATYEAMNPLTRPFELKTGPRGYVRAGYGSHGNVDFKAGYLWDLTKVDRLEVAAHLDGMNGKLKAPTDADWKSRFYDSGIKLGYQHRFSGVTLRLGGGYQSQVFNYMPIWQGSNTPSASDKQHHTLGNFFVGLKSHTESLPLQFAMEMGYNYFDKKYAPFTTKTIAEKEFYVKGDVWGYLNDEQRVGIDFKLNNYTYGAPQQDDFLSLQFNPYYSLGTDSWKIRLGAHVDWQNSNGSGFKVAPDIKIDYIFADSYVLYLYAEGGRVLNDFRRLNSISPYWNTSNSIASSYVPLNASLGFKASPINNLWFNLYGGYRICEQDLSGLLYEDKLMNVRFLQDKSKAAYGGAELKYSYREQVNIGVKGTAYSWKADGKDSKLFLASKPQAEVNVELAVRVIKPLQLRVNYDYIKREKTPFIVRNAEASASGEGTPFAVSAENIFLGNVSNLSLGATYNFIKGVTIFVDVRNILNKEYYLENLYPAQGINFLGGLSFQF